MGSKSSSLKMACWPAVDMLNPQDIYFKLSYLTQVQHVNPSAHRDHEWRSTFHSLRCMLIRPTNNSLE